MEQNNKIITRLLALLIPLLLTACSNDAGEADTTSDNVRVNTIAVAGTRAATVGSDNSFMLLFWSEKDHLELNEVYTKSTPWPEPYFAVRAPQPVDFYQNSVFDTNHPYPADETKYIYATGYAPGNVLVPDANDRYKRLIVQDDGMEKGRYDLLGCDVWSDVYKGSLKDPFAQDKNKLYFRHLAAKLVFYADRDKESMENKQYVRNVKITNLEMSIDGGTHWRSMYTPSEFEWKALSEGDITTSYGKVIDAVRGITGNESASGTRPFAGYKVSAVTEFAGRNVSGDNTKDYVLQKNATDRVPISGMVIDSCYVCNPLANNGNVLNGSAIKLRMDISAELSFDPNFPMSDDKGSTTDDLTFTRHWNKVVLEAINAVDENGNVQENDDIKEFKPGNEYRVFIHFNRTGVNLVARELLWNIGGVHHVTIVGGDKPQE